MKRYVLNLLLIFSLFAVSIPNAATAAPFPNKPIVVVIPFGAGGSHDLHARGITSIMADIVGQPMIVKLLPGGAGMKATGFVANIRPDGYTLLFTHNGIDMIVPQTRKVPFNTLKAFKTVAKINHSAGLIITNIKSRFKTFKQIIDYAKKNPGQLNWGHSGIWGASYTNYQMIAKATGIRANLIPHKGGGPLLRATLAGRLDIGSCQTTQCRPQIKAGKIRALAALGNKRFEGDPDFKHVPSMPELGYPGVGFQMERIFLVPSNTSPERIKYLRDAFVKLTKHKSYKRFMKSIGMPTQFMEGSEYDKGRPKQFAIFTELIKEMTRK